MIIGDDAPLYTLLIAVVEENLARDSVTSQVLRGNQPTKQGMAEGRAIYLHKIMDFPIGQPERKTVPDPDDATQMVRTTSRWYETTIQIGAASPYVDGQPEVTAGDLAAWAHAVFASEEMMAALKTLDRRAQVLRVGLIRTTYPKNDSDEYEEWATFDFVLTRRKSMVRKTPIADPIAGSFHAIE